MDVEAIARVCERRGTLLEINNHHGHLTLDEIKAVMGYDVSFVLSSDAHKPKNVGRIDGALERANEAGLDLSRIVNYRG